MVEVYQDNGQIGELTKEPRGKPTITKKANKNDTPNTDCLGGCFVFVCAGV